MNPNDLKLITNLKLDFDRTLTIDKIVKLRNKLSTTLSLEDFISLTKDLSLRFIHNYLLRSSFSKVISIDDIYSDMLNNLVRSISVEINVNRASDKLSSFIMQYLERFKVIELGNAVCELISKGDLLSKYYFLDAEALRALSMSKTLKDIVTAIKDKPILKATAYDAFTVFKNLDIRIKDITCSSIKYNLLKSFWSMLIRSSRSLTPSVNLQRILKFISEIEFLELEVRKLATENKDIIDYLRSSAGSPIVRNVVNELKSPEELDLALILSVSIIFTPFFLFYKC